MSALYLHQPFVNEDARQEAGLELQRQVLNGLLYCQTRLSELSLEIDSAESDHKRHRSGSSHADAATSRKHLADLHQEKTSLSTLQAQMNRDLRLALSVGFVFHEQGSSTLRLLCTEDNTRVTKVYNAGMQEFAIKILDNLLEKHRERTKQGESRKPNVCVENIESLSTWLDLHAEHLRAQQRLNSSSKPIVRKALEELILDLVQGLEISPDARCRILGTTIKGHDRFHPCSLNPTAARPLGSIRESRCRSYRRRSRLSKKAPREADVGMVGPR